MTGEQGSPISVGQELRRAREVRRVTLAQLAAETRIALRHLEALEQDRFDDLPGRLYARNFVRQVARSLGADEQELVDYFDYQSGEGDRGAAADEATRAGQDGKRRLAYGALACAALIIAAALGHALTRGEPQAETGSQPGTAGPEASAAALAEGEAAPTADSEAVEAEPVVAEPQPVVAEPAPVVAKPKPEVAKPKPEVAKPKPVVASPEPVAGKPAPAKPVVVAASPTPETEAAPSAPRVRLVFSGPSWIEIVPDGPGPQIMGLKTAGQEVSFALDSPVELTVANAGNVELLLDGRPTRTLGVAGERRTLRLDADNWQSFLR